MLRVTVIRSNACNPDARVARITNFLISQGYQTTLLCWDRNVLYSSTEKMGLYKIYRIHIPAEYSSGIKLFPRLLCFWWEVSKYLIIHQKNIDIIHACDLDTYLPALFVAKLTHKKIIYDIFDYYSQGGNIPNLLKGILKHIEINMASLSDQIILVDENRLDYFPPRIIKKLHTKRKISIIYNTPEDIYNDLNKNGRVQTNKLTLVYAGSFSRERYIEELIIACGEMSSRFDLMLAGSGEISYMEYLKTHLLSLYSNCRYLGILQPIDALRIEAQSDVVVSFYNVNVTQNRSASPNKFFEALMLGKSFLTNAGNGIDKVVLKNNVGFVVSNTTVSGIKDELLYIWKHQNELKMQSNLARQLYTKKYSYTNNINKLKLIYQTLIGQS